MSLWHELAPALAGGDRLTYEQSRAVMEKIMAGELDDVKLSAFLAMLAVRGVGVTELRGLADQMQSAAERIALPSNVVDIVGTGGDKANTVNISTMAAIVIAAAGYPVVKHGNRASTSACGSADLLEALGVDLDLQPSRIVNSFYNAGIAFLFANKFHPSMRHAARVRRDLGFPTAFNILGPLTNPVRPTSSAVGVARQDAAPLVAGVFAERGTNAFVFRGTELGLDELSTVEPSEIWAVSGGEVTHHQIDPASVLALPRSTVEDLRGGDAATNAHVAREVLSGTGGVVADAVAANAAIGMLAGALAGTGPHVDSLGETDVHSRTDLERGLAGAFAFAQDALASGAAAKTLDTWVKATQR